MSASGPRSSKGSQVALGDVESGFIIKSGLPLLSGTTLDGMGAVVDLFDYENDLDLSGLKGGLRGTTQVDWTSPWEAHDVLNPQVFGMDEFNYTDGASLDGLSGGNNWSGAWVAKST